MSSGLSQQILAILKLADEPLYTAQVAERLRAMGAAHPEDAHKRLGSLRKSGAVVAVAGEGRKLRWRIGSYVAAERVEAKARRKPKAASPAKAPTFTGRVLEAIAARPGSTCNALSAALEAAGHVPGRNEPSATLHNLIKQGRIRHEGNQPNRRYYPVQCATAETPAATTPPPTPPPAATPAPTDRTAMLAQAVFQHLEIEDGWHRSAALAEDLDEEQWDVAKALAKLEASGRAVSRLVAGKGVREYAHPESCTAVEWLAAEEARKAKERARHEAAERASAEAAMDAIAARPAMETGPLEDSHGPIATESRGTGDTVQSPVDDQECAEPTAPAAEAPPAAIPDAVVDAALTLGLVQSDLHLRQVARASRDVVGAAAELAAVADESATQLGHLIRALDQEAALPDVVDGIAMDIEDTIGRACDERADHRVVKALALAAGALRRAQIDLLRAA